MSYRSALRHPGFRSLWGAQVVSLLGNRLHEIALYWIVLVETGDPFLLTLTVAATTVPGLLTALPAGAYVDRYNRKYLLIAGDVIRAVSVLAIPIFGPRGYLIESVLFAGVVNGAVDAFFSPAAQAILPNVVDQEDLDAANALSQSTASASQLLYAGSTVIIHTIGPYNAFLVDAGTFVLSGMILLLLPKSAGVPGSADRPQRGSTSSMRADVREGIRYIFENRVVATLLVVVSAIALVSAPLAIVIPVFASQTLEGGGLAFGLLFSSYYAGMVVGGFKVDDAVTNWVSRGKLVVFGTLLSGVFLTMVPLVSPRSPAPEVVAGVFFFLSGLATIFAKSPSKTIIQTVTPNEQLGRVFSVLKVSMLVGPPIGLAVAGAAISSVGHSVVFVGLGVGITLIGVLALFTPLNGVEIDQQRRPASAPGD